MSQDKPVLAIVNGIVSEIAILEKEVSRAQITDLPTHTRLQGRIDGLEKALAIIDVILMGDDE